MSLEGSPGPSSYSGDHDGIAEDIGKSGKVKYYEQCVLGMGSMGTIVHKGIYEDHLKVAVKVVPKHAIASLTESEILRELHHGNIVRYFLIDEERTARILVFELCEGCLVDLIELNEEKFNIPKIENGLKLSLAEDISKGLNYLHSRSPGIIHGDIKPQNILIRKDTENVITLTAVIADFGISLNINPDKSKMTAHENVIGSDGWRPKEILKMLKDGKTVRANEAVDIFSFGCVLHYIMASKETGYYMHPFGHPDQRNVYIEKQRRQTYLTHQDQDQLNIDVRMVLADMLIEECVNGDPKKRPTAQEIIKFPLFWKKAKFIWFLEMAANELYNDSRFNQNTFTEALEKAWSSLYNKNSFQKKIPEACKTYKCKAKRKFHKIYHFLKMLRNIRQHKGEILNQRPALKDVLGNGTDDDFYDYFVYRVVEAFPVVYTEFLGHPKIELEEFSDYYVHSGNKAEAGNEAEATEEAEARNHNKIEIYKRVLLKVFLENTPSLNRSRPQIRSKGDTGKGDTSKSPPAKQEAPKKVTTSSPVKSEMKEITLKTNSQMEEKTPEKPSSSGIEISVQTTPSQNNYLRQSSGMYYYQDVPQGFHSVPFHQMTQQMKRMSHQQAHQSPTPPIHTQPQTQQQQQPAQQPQQIQHLAPKTRSSAIKLVDGNTKQEVDLKALASEQPPEKQTWNLSAIGNH